MQVTTQLAFNGQCREAVELYEKVLGGKISVMNTFGVTDINLPPGSTALALEQIGFAALQIGDHAILANGVPEPEYRAMHGSGNRSGCSPAPRVTSGRRAQEGLPVRQQRRRCRVR